MGSPRMGSKRLALLPAAAALVVLVELARLGVWAFVSPHSSMPSRSIGSRVSREASSLPGGLDTAALEEMMKDPEKMKKLQEEMDAIMKDPEKKKAIDAWSGTMQSAVDKLKDDPELKDFFEDIKNNGIDAMKKYEKDERILRKFSMASGGPQGMPGFDGGMGMPAMRGAAPRSVVSFKPGDEVIIRGLEKAPELNGKKAMVVPPTSEEKKNLEGTDRLIVRLMDTGDQFAVRPANLRTTAQEADELMGSNLEDVSIYNPALQTEAAKLRESGKLEELQNDPELQPIFADIKKNGMAALEKYWNDERLMGKISKAMGTA